MPRAFEENPRTMSLRDLLYFTYKYYYKPPTLPPDGEVKAFLEAKTGRDEIFETVVTVSVGGDLMPYEMITPSNTAHLWDEVGDGFFGSDIVFANLETPLDVTKKPHFVPEVMLSHMHFNTDDVTLNIFSGMGRYRGYDILSIANNHSLDMGREGLLRTMDHLEGKGILTVGARKTGTEKNFRIVEVKGIRIGFVAYTYSLNEYLPPDSHPWAVNYLPLNCAGCDISLIRQDVKACREEGADIVIASMHCGNAYQAYPSAQTATLFKDIFETCGVDVIAGGHPHNLQPWNDYEFTDPFTGKRKTGFVIFSLGDFIAYDIFTWCHLCAYLKLEIGRNNEGQVVFRPVVRPMVMQRTGEQLKLVYAENVLAGDDLKGELKDLKILYDICMKRS